MKVTPGATDVTTYFVLRLTTNGLEATGLTVTNFDLQYVRTRTVPVAKVDASALGATDAAHTDNAAIEIDPTDQPGLYRVDWPDAAFAAGAAEVLLTVKCATAFTEHLRVELETLQGGDSFARLGAPTGDSVSADLDAMQARLPAALIGGRMDSNIEAINNMADAADRLQRSAQGIVLGMVGVASTPTSIVTSSLDPAAAVADQYKGRIVTFKNDTTTTNLRGQSTDITANTNLGVLTVTALTTAPVSGDTFTIN